MNEPQIDGLSVWANGVFPVELSAGKRINAHNRVPLRASVDSSTGEVRFYVEPESIEILRPPSGRNGQK